MNNKIVSSKKTIAFFLAIVLVTGTITLLSQSLFMTEAQAQQYYNEMDNNNYKKSYGYDTYYKPQYSSYGKDYRDKSQKDSSNFINKIKCTTNNINVNGDITGDVNLGNTGQVASTADAEERYLNTDGYSGDERYYDDDGYNNNKKDKGYECIINNNTNTNNVVGISNATDGISNATGGNGNVTLTCEECLLENLGGIDLANLFPINVQGIIHAETREDLCNFLEILTTEQDKIFGYNLLAGLLASTPGIEEEEGDSVLDCLERLGLIIPP